MPRSVFLEEEIRYPYVFMGMFVRGRELGKGGSGGGVASNRDDNNNNRGEGVLTYLMQKSSLRLLICHCNSRCRPNVGLKLV